MPYTFQTETSFHIGHCFLIFIGFLVGCNGGLAQKTELASADKSYSVLEGNTVGTFPDGATFRIPDSWLEWKPYRNVFLSRDEISDLNRTNGFTYLLGEAKTMNSVSSLDFCTAHLGMQRWNAGIISDQVRLYISNTGPDEVARRIEGEAIKSALRSFDKAELKSDRKGPWQKFTLEYFLSEGHTILFREIDFYIRGCGEKTVVFVFIHSVGGDKYVGPILDSFQFQPHCSTTETPK